MSLYIFQYNYAINIWVHIKEAHILCFYSFMSINSFWTIYSLKCVNSSCTSINMFVCFRSELVWRWFWFRMLLRGQTWTNHCASLEILTKSRCVCILRFPLACFCSTFSTCCTFNKPVRLMLRCCLLFLSSKHVKWCRRFCESGIILASTETSMALEWVEEAVAEESRCVFDSGV